MSETPPWDIDGVYFYAGAHSFAPPIQRVVTHTVDITNTIEKKLEALGAHESQMEWLRDHGGLDAYIQDPVSERRATAMQEGRLAGCTYGEPFIALRARAFS
jgi:LmbE family N-acetylglucosaminyl deacetylase